MSIFGLGVDLVHIPKIARIYDMHGARFLRKFLHPDEIAQLQNISHKHQSDAFLASRWASKEAAYKAFGKFQIPFPDFKVTSSPKTPPILNLEGVAKKIADEFQLQPLLSMSHDGEYATATVILCKTTPGL